MSGMIKKVDVPSTTPITEVPADTQPSTWYFDEGIPGTGDRPDWLEPKYNKVTDQAKAYKEAERKLGTQGAPAPDDYILDEYKELFDIESPHILDLKNKAKELRLSQDAFKALVDPFANYHKSLMPDTDKEIEKLGEHAQMKINTVNTWASNHLSDKSLETLGNISHTADIFNLMDEIRQLHSATQSKVPTNMQASGPVNIVTPEQIQQKIIDNYELYQKDSGFRTKLNQEMKIACGEE
jgi:hypothetical protein